MSDNINLGNVQAGVFIAGGTGHTVGSGTVNNYGSPAEISRLRALLEDLVEITSQDDVPTEVCEKAQEAQAEAAKPEPDTGRLRQLITAVYAGAERIATVTTAAVNIIGLLDLIEKIR
jgi:hypothetical protein